jgi:hypothetical protein
VGDIFGNFSLGVPLRVGLSATSPRSQARCGLFASIPHASSLPTIYLTSTEIFKDASRFKLYKWINPLFVFIDPHSTRLKPLAIYQNTVFSSIKILPKPTYLSQMFRNLTQTSVISLLILQNQTTNRKYIIFHNQRIIYFFC